VLAFIAIIAVYALGKKFLLSQLHLSVAAFSMNNATSPLDLFKRTLLVGNLETLFSPTVNHVIFVNAGTLVALLALGWRKRFLPYMAVVVAYLGGQLLYGGINEFRIFMQILPLSLMLMSERWSEAGGPVEAGLTAHAGPAWTWCETFPVLAPLTILLVAVTSGIAAARYDSIYRDIQPARRAQSGLGTRNVEITGQLNNPVVEHELLRSAYVHDELEFAKLAIDDQRSAEALQHFQRALRAETNSVAALDGLAWLQATAWDPHIRNADEAVRLAERACELSQTNQAPILGTLAVAYAEAGRYSNALVTARNAHALAVAQGQKDSFIETELEMAKVAIANRRLTEAIDHYRWVLAVDTNSVGAMSSLAWVLATAPDARLRSRDEAVRLAERACQLTQNQDATLIGIEAAAYAEAGRFDEAVRAAEKARSLAEAAGQKDVASRTDQLLKLYKAGRPFHQGVNDP